MPWKKLLLAAVASLVALEALLQIGALLIAWLYVAPSPPPNTGDEVLCIGDSYTFGVGASSPAASYPGALRTLLAESGRSIQVVNAGYPGQHSGDLVERLSSQLSPATKVLCVLVGTNDSWRRPSRVSVAASGARPTKRGFELCWRTGRLLALFARFEFGSWHESGKAEQAALASEPTGPTPAELAHGYRLLESAGVLSRVPKLAKYAPDPVGPAPPSTAQFWELMGKGDLSAGLALARELVAGHPESPTALALHAAAAVRGGHLVEADQALAALAQIHSARPSPASAENLAQALLARGKTAEALVLAKQRVREEPLAIVAWQTLQQAAFTLGDEGAVDSMVETLALLGTGSPVLSGFIARNLARSLPTTATERVAKLLVAATLLDGDFGATRLATRVVKGAVPRSAIEASVGDRSGSPVLRGMSELLDEVYEGKGSTQWCTTLTEHLVAIGERAQAQGTQVVILTYPSNLADVEAAQRDAASVLGVPLLRVRERFDRELRSRQRSELFVPDGHCSDAGYRIMAEMLAEAIGPLLSR